MTIEGAVIQEQGVTFGVVIVRPHVLYNTAEARRIMRATQTLSPFHGIPVVLMAQDGFGVPTYYGRDDIVNFMANVPIERVPWQRYFFN